MVKITDEYYYTVDSGNRSFALYSVEVREKLIQRTKQKSGEVGEVKTVLGYFNSLDKVVKTVADDILARKCNNGEIKDISQYVAEYRKAVAEIVTAINGNENKEETNND